MKQSNAIVRMGGMAVRWIVQLKGSWFDPGLSLQSVQSFQGYSVFFYFPKTSQLLDWLLRIPP